MLLWVYAIKHEQSIPDEVIISYMRWICTAIRKHLHATSIKNQQKNSALLPAMVKFCQPFAVIYWLPRASLKFPSDLNLTWVRSLGLASYMSYSESQIQLCEFLELFVHTLHIYPMFYQWLIWQKNNCFCSSISSWKCDICLCSVLLVTTTTNLNMRSPQG